MERVFDYVSAGGGIVGCSATRDISIRRPHLRGALLESKGQLATQQTGHSSEVIHSGALYQEGTQKARFCVRGRNRLVEYLDQKEIPYRIPGKVVVAKTKAEIAQLHTYYQQGIQNGIPENELKILSQEELREREPYSAGIGALWVGTTGVVDFSRVARGYAEDFQENGGEVLTNTKILGIKIQDGLINLDTTAGTIKTRSLINCTGLYAETIASMMGVKSGVRTVPVRGEFYSLTDEAAPFVRNSIYQVANPKLPFVDIHLTRTINDQVIAGPNAVLAFAKEGYHKGDINLAELLHYTLLFVPGFYRMVWRYWMTGRDEFIRSFSKKIFTRSVQELVPAVRQEHLRPYRAGVRAQAVAQDGSLYNDFLILNGWHSLHALNVPSPAATASPAIGEHIASRAIRILDSL